jgi:membrane protease YdiL (CAAX protease family)
MTRLSNIQFAIKIFLLGLLGILSLLLSQLPLSLDLSAGQNAPYSALQLQLLILLQPLIILAVSVGVGTLLYRKVGLKAPILSTKFNFKVMRPQLKAIAKSGAFGGIGVGTALMLVSVLGELGINGQLHNRPQALDISFLTALLYGGIAEEIMMRFGLMTLLVWMLWKISKSTADWVFIVAIVVSSVLFAAAHLPIVYASLQTVSFGVLTYILAANTIAGLVYGYLYWKKGLECSMLAHMMTHVTFFFLNSILRAVLA